jgi:hypothetical protein
MFSSDVVLRDSSNDRLPQHITLDSIFHNGYIPSMAWEVEYTDEFEAWWDALDEGEQIDIAAIVGLLESLGPCLPYPYSSDARGSKYGEMRELRIQHEGKPYRIFYAFDPRRAAILLIGGRKTSSPRWYDKFISAADKIYEEHLKSLEDEKRRKR